METFADWLEEKMLERGLTQAELARRSKTTSATISRILNGERNIGPEMCVAVAGALKVPPDDVYRAAGLLPMKPNNDETVTEIVHIYHLLNEDNKDDLLDYAKNRLSKQERGDKKNVRRVRVS